MDNTSNHPGLTKRSAPPTAVAETTKKKQTSAETSKAYRERLQQDPEMYRAYKAYENQQVKAYVVTISEEKREQYRAKTKLRVKKYLAKKKTKKGSKGNYFLQYAGQKQDQKKIHNV